MVGVATTEIDNMLARARAFLVAARAHGPPPIPDVDPILLNTRIDYLVARHPDMTLALARKTALFEARFLGLDRFQVNAHTQFCLLFYLLICLSVVE